VKPTKYLLVILSGLVLASCGGKKTEEPPATTGSAEPPPATAPPAAGGDAKAQAKQIFMQRCVPCHGATGQGDGPASATLNPKPRKYADPEWQASVTDDYIEKIIKFGGAAVGKSPAMPNNPDLSDPAVISALKDIVRGFNPKK